MSQSQIQFRDDGVVSRKFHGNIGNYAYKKNFGVRLAVARTNVFYGGSATMRLGNLRAFCVILPALLAGPALAEDDYKGPLQLEDGMYTESWFLQSFLDLREDLETAAGGGKRFVIMWELKGCPYCKETHFKNFADAGIRHFVRDNFEVLQLNIQGSRMVTDFDGKEIAERDLATKYGVRFTPTFQFFPETADGLESKTPREREVARIPGYFRPPHFLAMFRYVRERAYASEDFRSYLKRHLKGS